MFSAEPWTAPGRGFPELFQTGETFKGRPIIDAQHPHDLFMGLAANRGRGKIKKATSRNGPVALLVTTLIIRRTPGWR